MTTMTTIIGLVESAEVGRKLIDELVAAGLPKQDVEILEGDEDEVMSEIVERGFDQQVADGYVQSIDDGKVLVAAWAPDDQVDRAVAIMGRYESPENEEDDVSEGGDEKVLEVGEELSVNKRKVAQGGVRVTRSVIETPVEETVSLRTERVEVDRQPVERKLSDKEATAAFQEKTVEMLATTEEAEVTKEAYVAGEVSLSKRAEEREETVKDTVRRTHVEVEKIEPASGKTPRSQH